ncbi:hypothetical protein [Cupriavidus sp. UYPR2.512]|uniref:hypothetical protein n=1 Tax=Cupriavidus sp. UYPR2.512 TaxID=1080187 RepID=UPI0003A9BC1B|nr:hypothetical protein [Cupriavidus sp. UYPR2.512]UIF87878.1 hypothetical protein KAF44_01105 [Cupriavidus necator]
MLPRARIGINRCVATQLVLQRIGTAFDRADPPLRQVRRAGDTMGEIVSHVYRVTGIISEINRAAAEQTRSIQ